MAQASVIARYLVRLRNTSFAPQDAIANYRKFSFIKRFNLVGAWALELDATDPVAAQLMQPGWGIQIERTLANAKTGMLIGTPSVEMSGNMNSFTRTKVGETLTVAGYSDMAMLSGVEAWPVTNYPYQGYITGLANLARYYRMNDVIGTTTAKDLSTNNSGGTETAVTFSGAGFGLSGMDDDTAGYAHFVKASNSKIVQAAATALPTGDGDWTESIRFRMNAVPAAGTLMALVQLGNTGTNWQGVVLWCDEFMELKIEPTGNTQGDIFTPVIAVSTWHTFGATYNHLTHLISLYLDGVLVGTQVYQTLALTQQLTIGAQWTGSVYQNSASMDCNEVIVLTRACTADEMFNMQATPFSRFNFSAYDVQAGVDAETAMRHYVDVNAVHTVTDPLGVTRALPPLRILSNSHRGSTVNDQTRFDKLVLKDGTGILQRLALNGGGLGFDLVPSGSLLNFTIYQPTDRSAIVRFSDELGNVTDYSYGFTGPDPETGANVVAVGGGGDGVARIFVFREDATSIGLWGRIENFQDARDTLDVPTMQARGDATLATSGQQTSFSATLAQATDAVYGLDFFLGDKVTVTVDAGTFSDYVREVDVDVEQGAAELVNPQVGTPGADFIQTADSKLRKQTRQNLARLDALERRK